MRKCILPPMGTSSGSKRPARLRRMSGFKFLAHPISVIRKYMVPEMVSELEPVYERALLGELERIAKVIPHDQLAIQWDVASGDFPTSNGISPRALGKIGKRC